MRSPVAPVRRTGRHPDRQSAWYCPAPATRPTTQTQRSPSEHTGNLAANPTHLDPATKIPHLGGVRLDKLRVSHLDALFDAIEERNELITTMRASREAANRDKVKGMRAVSAATMHRIRATLRAALNAAIRQGFIDVNHAAHVELPTATRPKPLVWTDERVEQWKNSGALPGPVMVWTPAQTEMTTLAQATWAPAGTGQLARLIAETGIGMSELVDLLQVPAPRVLALRRGQAAATEPEARALAPLLGSTVPEILDANPALPDGLVSRLSQPNHRIDVHRLAAKRGSTEREAWQAAAFGVYVLAARQTGGSTEPAWDERIDRYFAMVLE